MKALQYSTTEGHPPLRRKIAERMKTTWDAHVTPEQILVTSGSQQGLDLDRQAPPRRGRRGPLREPDLPRRDLRLERLPPALGRGADGRRRDGPRPTSRAALRAHPNAKAIYVIPNFQNPSGRTWSLERRRPFMEIVERHDVCGRRGQPLRRAPLRGRRRIPSLKSLDRKGRVIALGTFSKVFCPGLRIAWIAADDPVLREARHPQAGGRPADLDARPAPGEPLPRGERPRRRHRADHPRLPRAARRDARRARRRDARRGPLHPAPRAASSSG